MAVRKSMGINAFFRDELGASLANSRWSWGGVDERNRRVYLRLWRSEIRDEANQRDIQLLRKDSSNTGRPGWAERTRHIELIRSGYAGFGVLCVKESPEAGVILDFDSEELVVLGPITESESCVRAEIVGTVTPAQLQAESQGSETLPGDLMALATQPGLSATTRAALVDARIGQGAFRRQMLKAWGGCAVSGCAVTNVLRASHAKPWRQSNNQERLDPNNGLILTATLDALFDAGLIAFNDRAEMLISTALSAKDRTLLGLPGMLRKRPNAKQSEYLEYHREHVFRPA